MKGNLFSYLRAWWHIGDANMADDRKYSLNDHDGNAAAGGASSLIDNNHVIAICPLKLDYFYIFIYYVLLRIPP